MMYGPPPELVPNEYSTEPEAEWGTPECREELIETANLIGDELSAAFRALQGAAHLVDEDDEEYAAIAEAWEALRSAYIKVGTRRHEIMREHHDHVYRKNAIQAIQALDKIFAAGKELGIRPAD